MASDSCGSYSGTVSVDMKYFDKVLEVRIFETTERKRERALVRWHIRWIGLGTMVHSIDSIHRDNGARLCRSIPYLDVREYNAESLVQRWTPSSSASIDHGHTLVACRPCSIDRVSLRSLH